MVIYLHRSHSIATARKEAARKRRAYKKACDACITCRFKQSASTQSLCDNACNTCSLAATQYATGPTHPLVGGNQPNDNAYGINFESGTGTVSCYNYFDKSGIPAPQYVKGHCGSNVYPPSTISGIDFDAAIPLAYFPPGSGNYGNCNDCNVTCSTWYSDTAYVWYNGAPLCYNITSKINGMSKIIRVNDVCGAFTLSGKRVSALFLKNGMCQPTNFLLSHCCPLVSLTATGGNCPDPYVRLTVCWDMCGNDCMHASAARDRTSASWRLGSNPPLYTAPAMMCKSQARAPSYGPLAPLPLSLLTRATAVPIGVRHHAGFPAPFETKHCLWLCGPP